jgi:type VI secretion system secreted protein Hcp
MSIRINVHPTMKNSLNRFSSMLALVAPTAALIASNANAAMYIKFDGIDGESVSVDHKEWIIVDSMAWGVTAPNVDPAGGTGKVVIRDFTITHRIDKASPKLFLACATGQTIPTVTLSVTRMVNGAEVEYYQIILQNVRISGMSSAGATDAAGTPGGDDRPQESVSFKVFPKVEIKYKPINDATGVPGSVVTSGVLETEPAPATN